MANAVEHFRWLFALCSDVCSFLLPIFKLDFLILLFCFESSFYSLDTIFVVHKYSSKFGACLFILLTGTFAEWNLKILMRLNLSTFPFMNLAFGVKLKNHKDFHPCFSKCFIFLCFTCKSMIHFEVILHKGWGFLCVFKNILFRHRQREK